MIRKPVFLRALGLLAVYGAVFFILVFLQFTRPGNFTQRIGGMVVSGQYRTGERGDKAENPGEFSLNGGASLFFGGLEYRIRTGDEAGAFALIDREGARRPVDPDVMRVSGDSVSFRFPGGTELAFAVRQAGADAELRISGTFAGNDAGAEIPWRPLRTSRVRENGEGQYTVITGGVTYSFARPAELTAGRKIFLRAGGGPVVYRAVPEKQPLNPEDYILPPAATRQAYTGSISRWRDQSFALWNRIIASQNDEDLVIAYSGEAVRRGAYRAAVSAVSPLFLAGNRRTYESSVYLGGMDQALRSFTSLERETISRLSRLITEKSPDILRESHVFEYVAIRSPAGLFEDGLEHVRSLDPSAVTLELTPGILEGWLDLKQYRPHGDNPFERLIGQTLYVISEGVRGIGEIRLTPEAGRNAVPVTGTWVFVFRENQAETEFNLRLGKALGLWAEEAGRNDWAGLGRSLVLSVLSLEDGAGTIPRSLSLSPNGEAAVEPGPRISGARLYRLLAPGEYLPRPIRAGSGVNGIWAWTAASALSATQENKVLDIAVSFLPGETHYMMIRGLGPFSKIQLYNMDYRTDPEFERYDSSGWVYSAREQILTLKMKHRSAVEHIRIFYQEETEP
jgi:hypothetical protein